MEMGVNDRKFHKIERHRKKIHFEFPNFISAHFPTFLFISFRFHSNTFSFLFNCSSSQMIDQARMMRIIGNKSGPQRS